MNAVVEAEVMQPSRIERLPAASVTPMHMLQAALDQGADLAKLEQLMGLQERWEAAQARKDYFEAMANFRRKHIHVGKSGEHKAGPLEGVTYAKLHDFVSAVSSPLSEFGLSASWKILRDEPGWIEVACIVAHQSGHTEQRTMGGPPDTGGAKNAIQARASTVSYLEKYTLKMALGLAEADDDNDAAGGGPDRITDSQAMDLEALISETGANREGFLKYLRVTDLRDLPAKKYQAACAALNARRK
jgi:hypothetical protein